MKDLKNLPSLDLSYIRVSDISALKDLKNLSTLNLSTATVSDLSPLARSTFPIQTLNGNATGVQSDIVCSLTW